MTEQQIRERIRSFTHFAPPARLRIVTDTSEFMSIQAGDVLELNGRFFLIRGEEMEGRFGLDGEPKFWVKKAIDLESGQPKVIKLVFHETFLMRLGEYDIRCLRSPTKESRILDKVRHHPHFMQGITLPDQVGNPVRVIDKVQGTRFYDYIHDIDMDHEQYFHELFPSVFSNVVSCISDDIGLCTSVQSGNDYCRERYCKLPVSLCHLLGWSESSVYLHRSPTDSSRSRRRIDHHAGIQRYFE